MTDDLLSQLADYGRYHRAEQRPVDITAIGHRPPAGPAGSAFDAHNQPTTDDIDDADVVVIDLKTSESRRPTDMRNKWIVRTGAAVAAAIVVIVGVVVLQDDAPSTNVAAADPEAVVDAYFEAFNVGDADAVLALVTSDATFTEQFQSAAKDELEREDWEEALAWFTAQGSVVTALSCTEADDQSADHTTFTCDYELLDAPTQAVGAPPVPTTSSIVITSLRISEIQDNFDPSETGVDFLHVGEPFHGWLAATHPDLTCLAVSERSTSCDNWAGSFTSVEKATEQGQLVPQYAEEWAAHLEENGCTYLDGHPAPDRVARDDC